MLKKIRKHSLFRDTLALIGIILFLLICYIALTKILNIELYKDVVLGVVSGIASSIAAYIFYHSLEENRKKETRKYKELHSNLLLLNLYHAFPWIFPYFALKFDDIAQGTVRTHLAQFYSFVLNKGNKELVDRELKELGSENVENMRKKLEDVSETLANVMTGLHDEEKLVKVDTLLCDISKFSSDLYLYHLTRKTGNPQEMDLGTSFVSITRLIHDLGKAAYDDRKKVFHKEHEKEME